MKRFDILLPISICCVLLGACAHQPQGTLYHRLGGNEGLTEIVDNMLFYIAEKSRILHHFEDVDIDRFRDNLVIHLCELSDGPCRYQGDSMADVHRGMNVSAADFDSLVECLMDAMDETGVSYRNQVDLIRRLVPFHDEIVQPPDYSKDKA